MQSLCAAWYAAMSLQQTEQDGSSRDDVRCHGLHATAPGEPINYFIFRHMHTVVWRGFYMYA